MKLIKIKKEWILIILAIVINFSYPKLSEARNFKEVLISDDGNFLFYNSPSAISYGSGFFISYLKKEGEVMIDYWDKSNRVTSVEVHSYKDIVNKELGRADDHAAPAIISDHRKNRILIATAYHGSPIRVFAYYPKSNKIELLIKIDGQYTYPRFVKTKNSILLVYRNQIDSNKGNLAYRNSLDNFNIEYDLLEAESGSVVYAGIPIYYKNKLIFSYSIHSYEEKRLIGFKLSYFDLGENIISYTCDLNGFLKNKYISNRPTGIKAYKENIFISTSYFSSPVSFNLAEKINYSQVQTVKILKGKVEDCNSFEEIYVKEDVKMPYYDVDVAIGENGNYIFFNDDEFISNIKFKNCFKHKKMMYPVIVDGVGVFYAVMNSPYSIRNFDNSIYGCMIDG